MQAPARCLGAAPGAPQHLCVRLPLLEGELENTLFGKELACLLFC